MVSPVNFTDPLQRTDMPAVVIITATPPAPAAGAPEHPMTNLVSYFVSVLLGLGWG